jgi:hypothetical protein
MTSSCAHMYSASAKCQKLSKVYVKKRPLTDSRKPKNAEVEPLSDYRLFEIKTGSNAGANSEEVNARLVFVERSSTIECTRQPPPQVWKLFYSFYCSTKECTCHPQIWK